MALQGVSYITSAGRDAIAEALNSGQDVEIGSYGLSSQDIEISVDTTTDDLVNFLTEDITVGSKSALDGTVYVELKKTSDELTDDTRVISIFLTDGSLFIVIKPTYFIPQDRGLDFGLGIGVGSSNTELTLVNVTDGTKANLFGDCDINFSVKTPSLGCHAVNKKYGDSTYAKHNGDKTEPFSVKAGEEDEEAVNKKQMNDLVGSCVKKTGDTMTGNLRVPALFYGTPDNGMEGELAGNYWKLYNSKGKGSTKNEFYILGNISDSTDPKDDKVFSMFMADEDENIIGKTLSNKNGVWYIGGVKIANLTDLSQYLKKNSSTLHLYSLENGSDTHLLAENILGDTAVGLTTTYCFVILHNDIAHVQIMFKVIGFGKKTLPSDDTWTVSANVKQWMLNAGVPVASFPHSIQSQGTFRFGEEDGDGEDGAWNGNKDTANAPCDVYFNASTGLLTCSNGDTQGFHQSMSTVEVDNLQIRANFTVKINRSDA